MAYRNSQTAYVLKNAEALIAPTDFVRQIYASFGTPWEKIHVIPHGIRLPDMMPPKFEREDDILDVIYVGGISWQKGLHILVQAFNQLPAEHFRLTIYGDESTFPDYSARLRRLARQPEIRFAGRLPHQELWKALSLSDVLVVPSLWYETASLIIQEAFAARVPVVASDIGALKERIVDEENGLSIPPGDIEALRDVLFQLQSEPGRLAALGANIRPVRSVVEHAQDVSQLYQTILLPTTP
jgi:glycosyltransferase involved in cell wall biosynthesis